MKKSDFKNEFFKILDLPIDGMTFEEKINFVENLLLDYQKDNQEEFDTSNKGKPWSDEELKIILSDTATKRNCIKYAKIFKRTYGSIEQIYRWSVTTDAEIKAKGRDKDKFVQQIKRIYKELGLRS